MGNQQGIKGQGHSLQGSSGMSGSRTNAPPGAGAGVGAGVGVGRRPNSSGSHSQRRPNTPLTDAQRAEKERMARAAESRVNKGKPTKNKAELKSERWERYQNLGGDSTSTSGTGTDSASISKPKTTRTTSNPTSKPLPGARRDWGAAEDARLERAAAVEARVNKKKPSKKKHNREAHMRAYQSIDEKDKTVADPTRPSQAVSCILNHSLTPSVTPSVSQSVGQSVSHVSSSPIHPISFPRNCCHILTQSFSILISFPCLVLFVRLPFLVSSSRLTLSCDLIQRTAEEAVLEVAIESAVSEYAVADCAPQLKQSSINMIRKVLNKCMFHIYDIPHATCHMHMQHVTHPVTLSPCHPVIALHCMISLILPINSSPPRAYLRLFVSLIPILILTVLNASPENREKFCKIKLSAAPVQKNIVECPGAMKMFDTIGFSIVSLDATGEQYLLFNHQHDPDLMRIKFALATFPTQK
jgi:hypothetical protein